jgi:hypothetical protein
MGKVKRRRSRAYSKYKVGYGNPPKESQFKAGVSGNPKGRPKGTRNFKTDVHATLRMPVNVTREGKIRRISTQAAALLRVREKGLGGEDRSLDRLIGLAQTYGDDEPTGSMDLSVEDELVLQIYRRRLLSGAISEFKSISQAASTTQPVQAQQPMRSNHAGRARSIEDEPKEES